MRTSHDDIIPNPLKSETLKAKGRLLEEKQAAETLALRLAGLRSAIRDHLDPMEPLQNIAGDAVANMALELASKHIDYVAALRRIRTIEDALA